jgi:hypothetical protein
LYWTDKDPLARFASRSFLSATSIVVSELVSEW